MRVNSLRVRLLAGAGLWISLALLLTGAAVLYLFVSAVERSVREDLQANAARLTALIDPAAQDVRLTDQPADPRYDIPLSGFYWQISSNGQDTLRSRSLWDYRIEAPQSQGEGPMHFIADGPDGSPLSAMVLDVRFSRDGGARLYQIFVAQDRAVLDQSISRFGHDIFIALLVLGASLSLAAMAQVSLGLRPLRSLRRAVETIRRGENSRFDTEVPHEVVPLVREMNALLETQQKLIEFARSRAADLAHGLKTPLSALGTVSDQLRDRGDAANADMIDELVTEMGERIDYQLRLSRLRQRSRSVKLDTDLNEVLSRIVGVMRRTAQGEKLEWVIDQDEDLHLDIDRNDLVEMLGILLENAGEWAERIVRIRSARSDTYVRLTISDDSGKLSEADIRGFTSQGLRMDRRTDGNGLGLGIVREIVHLNGGKLDFSRSPDCGLQIAVDLPLA
ncbi:sensor histidine kinase [Paracoccus aestuariivivens]|uniref:histidine kinase n=1 Tax=Paracoccus aestuariivivens TaxID=1820333 RepID=A0A6L6JJT4_9RHOB|nr:HAMP domain-containing sensor histidine kinase [Paracoccus aestuariivivens]MTH80111.1 GHKL domain-containing protein [Paracoccus aestuariivivens]